MQPNRLMGLAVAGEGALVVLAMSWHVWHGQMPVIGSVPMGLAAGTLTALLLGCANLYLLCGAPDMPGVRAVRKFYREELKPLFCAVRLPDVMVISIAAGLGEELFFRGVLQPELGLVPASLIFGALHVGGRATLVFGGWVTLMGAMLGGLAVWTGGLLAPIVAHAAYDAGALAYIRWGPDCGPLANPPEDGSEVGSSDE